jgi:hypothetical protein
MKTSFDPDHLINRELASAMALWGNHTDNVTHHILGVSNVKATPDNVQRMRNAVVRATCDCQVTRYTFLLEG